MMGHVTEEAIVRQSCKGLSSPISSEDLAVSGAQFLEYPQSHGWLVSNCCNIS